MVDGKPKFLYSWRLVPTDPQPVGKQPCLSLRELEKMVGKDLESRLDPMGKKLTVNELIARYLRTKTGVKPNTLANYNFVQNIMNKEEFGNRKIAEIKTSDAKLFLIKLQQDGKGSSTIKTIRGVLRPAFQMAVDDDILMKNPFGFELVGVIVNTEHTREAITKKQMNQFLKFVKDDNVYYKYYDAFYILFHTGLRISEFCGLTINDIDLDNRIINIDHQLQRTSKMEYLIDSTKTKAGTRKIPMTEDVYETFRGILKERPRDLPEKMVDGYIGFLFRDKNGMPEVAMHWQHRFNHAVKRYNDIFKIQMPNITPHVCRHTYCSNQARAGMNPKTLQYLMGHSDIGVTMNTYTHLGLDDAKDEMIRLEELEQARKELDKTSGIKPMKQNMFKAI
jgi:integrase